MSIPFNMFVSLFKCASNCLSVNFFIIHLLSDWKILIHLWVYNFLGMISDIFLMHFDGSQTTALEIFLDELPLKNQACFSVTSSFVLPQSSDRLYQSSYI